MMIDATRPDKDFELVSQEYPQGTRRSIPATRRIFKSTVKVVGSLLAADRLKDSLPAHLFRNALYAKKKEEPLQRKRQSLAPHSSGRVRRMRMSQVGNTFVNCHAAT